MFCCCSKGKKSLVDDEAVCSTSDYTALDTSASPSLASPQLAVLPLSSPLLVSPQAAATGIPSPFQVPSPTPLSTQQTMPSSSSLPISPNVPSSSLPISPPFGSHSHTVATPGWGGPELPLSPDAIFSPSMGSPILLSPAPSLS